MHGIAIQNGQPLSGFDHLRQSIRDILTRMAAAQTADNHLASLETTIHPCEESDVEGYS